MTFQEQIRYVEIRSRAWARLLVKRRSWSNVKIDGGEAPMHIATHYLPVVTD
jgi:hypothetical protein